MVGEVATPEIEGETRNSRLQVFLSSILSSFGGFFRYNNSQEQEQDMASRALVPLQHQQQLKGTIFFFFSFLISKPHFCFLLF